MEIIKECESIKLLTDSKIDDECSQTPSEDKTKEVSSVSSIMEPVEESSENFTSWEKWYIKKQEEAQKEKSKMIRQKQKEEKQKFEEEQLKKENTLKNKIKVLEWWQAKNEKETKEKMLKQQKLNIEKSLKEVEREENLIKNRKKYREWMMKKEIERMRVQRENELKNQQLLEQKKQRQKQSEESYKEWLKRNPKTSQLHINYAKSNSTVFCYYDRNTHGHPSYYNSIPWKSSMCEIKKPIPNKKRNQSQTKKKT